MKISTPDSKAETAIVKRTGQKEGLVQTLMEIWTYREMVASFVRRDLRGRYKGSVLGFLWTFLNPLLQLCVYTIVFSVILKSGIDDYHIHLFVALIPWIFFSTSVTGGTTAIIAQKDMVKKIYFPREVLPIAHVTTNFVNMLLCFLVVFVVTFASGRLPTRPEHFVALLCLIPLFAVEYILSLGMAFLVSAITVYLRDMEHILGIIMMAWQYLTPVLYSYDNLPDSVKPIFNLNPMSPVITAFREILYDQKIPDLTNLLWALLLGIFVMVVGWITFSKLKRRFAEEL